jgi:hypothetical protein
MEPRYSTPMWWGIRPDKSTEVVTALVPTGGEDDGQKQRR